ncbi:phosphotransferase [Sanguibacter suaedae]|uniref:Phosphotransferase n=1 Tax=Sanguibacter suaedae TaxID=2795737 RepID=A0A934I7U3_9MICO|nr:phosphotransferase [Sanguibacter suaedae]MBI9115831.1 phosphotransferase [Sanguibacter suaedae]
MDHDDEHGTVGYAAPSAVLVHDDVLGDTVRKPATRATPAVHAFLLHLSSVGFRGAPRSFGIDDRGRHVVEYVPGSMSTELGPMTPDELRRLGELVRDLHDAASSFEPPEDAVWGVGIPAPGDDLVCHHDLAPWNLVRDGDRWVFIDWDGAGPGTRLWDLAYVAQAFLPLHAHGDPGVDGTRLRALVDGYGLSTSQRPDLVQQTADQTRAMHDLLVDGARTGTEPWATLHTEGHADHWGPAADYVSRHRADLRAALR